MLCNSDPGVGLGKMKDLAWYDETYGEIGDICEPSSGHYNACDGYNYSISLQYSNAQNSCVDFPAPACGSSGPNDAISGAPITTPTTAPVSLSVPTIIKPEPEPITVAPTTTAPTKTPSNTPTTSKPSKNPTNMPITLVPTNTPTNTPITLAPTDIPTNAPITLAPTDIPTNAPITILPTKSNAVPTVTPSKTIKRTKSPVKSPKSKPNKSI